MRTSLSKIVRAAFVRPLLAATLGLALALTFSCSSDDGGGGGGESSSAAVSSSSVQSSSSSSPQTGVVHGTPVTYQDETYETVVIGTQTWMARNLNYNVEGSKCNENDESNCATYGRLYKWATAMALPPSCNSSSCSSQIGAKHSGICPSDWHIPSNDEWDVLTDYVGSNASIKLKATSGWNNSSNGTDDYGFAALPGGGGVGGGGFGTVGKNDGWWSSTENNAVYAWRRYMDVSNAGVGRYYSDKADLLSVRCVKD
jgi:uncharacterized protein (TIGR02145 family)